MPQHSYAEPPAPSPSYVVICVIWCGFLRELHTRLRAVEPPNHLVPAPGLTNQVLRIILIIIQKHFDIVSIKNALLLLIMKNMVIEIRYWTVDQLWAWSNIGKNRR